MANTFKNSISGSLGTTETTVYEAVGVTATVIGVAVSNVLTSSINVDIKMYDDSAVKNAYLIKNALIPASSNIILVGGEQKLVLEPNDYLTVSSSLDNSTDVIISVLEIS
jgi:hypothetical protein